MRGIRMWLWQRLALFPKAVDVEGNCFVHVFSTSEGPRPWICSRVNRVNMLNTRSAFA